MTDAGAEAGELGSEFIGKLDSAAAAGWCGSPDAKLFAATSARHIVAFDSYPSEDDIARLAEVARIQWIYGDLGIAEIDTDDVGAVTVLPFVLAAHPAWGTIDATRGIVVGLNAFCAFARHQALDLGAIYRHSPESGYPVLRADGDQKDIELDAAVTLPTPPALLPVVNISLGTTVVGFPTALNDIVNVATAATSSQALVVVAAGNCGDVGSDSLSAWARPDWVLSVGATDDADGTCVASYSSRGGPGPDLVALGRSALNERVVGTSFAAPRVSFLARFVVAAFCELGREILIAQGHEPLGVPAVGSGLIDGFGSQMWWQPERLLSLQALPLVGVHTDVVAALVDAVGAELTIRTTPAIMREVLLSSARPVPGASAAEVGAGFVDTQLVVERVADITALELWGWFGSEVQVDQVRLAQLRPFDIEGLSDLAGVVDITGPAVKFDYQTMAWLSIPRDLGLQAQFPSGVPIDLSGVRR